MHWKNLCNVEKWVDVKKRVFSKFRVFGGGVKISRFSGGQNFATFRVFAFSTPFSIFFVFWVNFCQLLSSFAFFYKKNHFFLKKLRFFSKIFIFFAKFCKKVAFFYRIRKKRPQTPGGRGEGVRGPDWGGTPPPNGTRGSPQTLKSRVDRYWASFRNWKTCVSIHP